MTPVAVLTGEQIVALVEQAMEPLRAELAQLRADSSAVVVSQSEAARRLGVSLRTVQRQVRTGRLASVKVGSARRVRLDGVLPPVSGTG